MLKLISVEKKIHITDQIIQLKNGAQAKHNKAHETNVRMKQNWFPKARAFPPEFRFRLSAFAIIYDKLEYLISILCSKWSKLNIAWNSSDIRVDGAIIADHHYSIQWQF